MKYLFSNIVILHRLCIKCPNILLECEEKSIVHLPSLALEQQYTVYSSSTSKAINLYTREVAVNMSMSNVS